jgi:hypothetical protein
VTPKSAEEYFIFGAPKSARPEPPRPIVSASKQERIMNIHQSSGMRNSLFYNDNDVTYGVVQVKPSESQKDSLFDRGNLLKEVWRPKTVTKWVEEYRAPLTLQ